MFEVNVNNVTEGRREEKGREGKKGKSSGLGF